ncbi:hypothetical protein CC99x_002300 [Candidatus Berkiella cookevillensis]|uniref:HTH cro/C1-type domain-containing protein n=1 Tax=Candidatus Berkiella cookevillensis TaxID=437022 RepID=A0A0Q9YKQ0_9GAMM|nr:hypothetical protein [Candidatus Berkiella cookevillensis]MCS5707730.1 hypothetical protein [Candidatus Berkiella cookevillensis]
MSKKPSTFERMMKDTSFKKEFNKQYKEFLLSELIIALMEHDGKSVRKLASECGLSTNVINKLRTGKQEDIKLSNFVSISESCGYHLCLQKNDEIIPIQLVRD